VVSSRKSFIRLKGSVTGCLFVCLSSGVLLTTGRAQENAVGSLSVVVRPDALVSVPPSITASAQAGRVQLADSSWVLRFDVPISVKIRLAQEVRADLVIDTPTDPAQLVPGFASGEIQVNGLDSGTFPASIPIDKSGIHALNGVITLRGAGALSQGTLPIRLTLRSHDGAIEWTQVVQLAWIPAAS